MAPHPHYHDVAPQVEDAVRGEKDVPLEEHGVSGAIRAIGDRHDDVVDVCLRSAAAHDRLDARKAGELELRARGPGVDKDIGWRLPSGGVQSGAKE